MSQKTFTGTGVALVTPFTIDEKIDIPAVKSLVEWQIESGVDMLVPAGTTGEAATLSRDEFQQLIETVIEVADGRVPVIAGTGTNNTRKVIEMSQFAQELGADGALVVSPYYNKPTQAGLYEHYRAIAGSIDIPVVLYNVPGRTGGNIAAETTLRLAEIKNIVAVKEASGNFSQISNILKHMPDDFSVLSGDDADALPIIALGGDGCISVVANQMPKEFVLLVNSAIEDNMVKAREMHETLLPLMEANFSETNPLPVKAVLAAMGKIKEIYRLPLVPMQDDTKKELLEIAKSMGLM
ncbi:MAG: 4-hydroxy-tetrahydrodipicolinate synthase [Candidatus Marinimicrobia bacterium]|nr:4-hydroxy-tetrahydrodipicolinate synthase [Candidatus Neomarinimicrobiota bacterium]